MKTPSCTSLLCEPASWQAVHSPLIATRIRPEGQKRKHPCQRRLLDARLWESLTPRQQSSAMAIDRSFRILSRGMGMRLSGFLQNLGGGGASHDGDADALSLYFSWGRRLQDKGLSHTAAMDIIAYGRSCREVDSLRRKRKGWARDNLGQALDLWL